jgi:hypothetical protein
MQHLYIKMAEKKRFVMQRISFKSEDSLSPKPQGRENKRFVITKRIAKHGRQAVIVVPAVLQHELRPGTLLQLTMDILEEARNE